MIYSAKCLFQIVGIRWYTVYVYSLNVYLQISENLSSYPARLQQVEIFENNNIFMIYLVCDTCCSECLHVTNILNFVGASKSIIKQTHISQ